MFGYSRPPTRFVPVHPLEAGSVHELGAAGHSLSSADFGGAECHCGSYPTRDNGSGRAVTGAVARLVALLQERRTALISAAITGKGDVRNLFSAEPVPA